MKTEAEIQRAHDILIEIILGHVPNPFPAEVLPFMQANCDVLCWLLGCAHNKTFGENLAKIEIGLAQLGFILQKAEKPFTEATHPLRPRLDELPPPAFQVPDGPEL